MTFKFSQKRIKNIAQEIAEEAKQFQRKSCPDHQTSSNKLTAMATLSNVFRYLAKRDGLKLVTAEKKSMGNYISAIFPFSNKIAILDEEYHQILSSDGFWLPIIIAHELGHWVLHVPFYKRFRRQLDLFSESNRIGSTFDDIRNIENPALDLLDQQANLFARELLLPEENVTEALLQMGYYPPVVYKEHHLNLMPFEEYCDRLAEKIHTILQIPIPWLRYRLTELHLLQNYALKKQLSSG